MHLEDNEEYLTGVLCGRDWLSPQAMDPSEIDRIVPANVYHPVHGPGFLARAVGGTTVVNALARFLPAGIPQASLPPFANERLWFPRALNAKLRSSADSPEQAVRAAIVADFKAADNSEVMATARIDLQIRPPLKWAGGKRWLVPRLKPLWEPYRKRRLVEPLCGGLAVTLGLLPKYAILNDINPHAINFYRWLQRGLRVHIPMKNDADLYYAHRDRFNQLISNGGAGKREAAELFYYLNRTGYNGLCRFNKSGRFNVPFGKYKSIGYREDFEEYKPLISGWSLLCGNFDEVKLRPTDFVYADPPYDVEFTHYAREGFSWEDQERLALWLSRHKGPVVLSNQATDRILSLYKKLGFECKLLNAPRNISCTGDRRPAREVIAVRGIDA